MVKSNANNKCKGCELCQNNMLAGGIPNITYRTSLKKYYAHNIYIYTYVTHVKKKIVRSPWHMSKVNANKIRL